MRPSTTGLASDAEVEAVGDVEVDAGSRARLRLRPSALASAPPSALPPIPPVVPAAPVAASSSVSASALNELGAVRPIRGAPLPMLVSVAERRMGLPLLLTVPWCPWPASSSACRALRYARTGECDGDGLVAFADAVPNPPRTSTGPRRRDVSVLPVVCGLRPEGGDSGVESGVSASRASSRVAAGRERAAPIAPAPAGLAVR
jgi:hypothetical protein